jgi:hypothetical protein
MSDDQTQRDERYGVLLLSPLRGEPSRPPRIDLARAMVEGRRRRMRRWAGGSAIIVLTAGAAAGGTLAVGALNGPAPRPAPRIVAPPPQPGPKTGPTACTVTRLPSDGARQSFVTGGDPSGRYLVGQIYGSKKPVVVWKDGRIDTRPAVPGTANRALRDLNTAGVGVATSNDAHDRQRSYVYRDGRFTKLPGGESDAVAINDAGAIAGTLGADRPALWPSPTAAPVALKLPPGASIGGVYGIDEDGTVLGGVGQPATDLTGYLWLPDGAGRRMPLPTVDGKAANFFWPESISDGWVAGRAVLDADDGSRRFAWYRYRVATNRYEPLPDRAGMPARVAANGWVAGVGGDGNVEDISARVTVFSDAGVLTLPKYRTDREYTVTSYSADGLVIGGSSAAPGLVNRALMWRCH